jgi:hypothetical protein
LDLKFKKRREMEKLHIKETKYTPEIVLDPDGKISIKGKSYPENTFEFYKPVMEWIEEYFENPKENTQVDMDIVYFNSSTSKFFFDMFDVFDENKDKTNLVINWYYEKDNEVAKEAGEDFVEDFEELDIRLVEK